MIRSFVRILAAMALALPIVAGVFLADGAPDRTARVPPSKYTNVPSRNMVNLNDRNLPTDWSTEKGKFRNIKWSAKLGGRTFGTPVIADGRVFVATSDAGLSKGMLMAFRETDGELLWQFTHDRTDHDLGWVWGPDHGLEWVWGLGLPSMPAVDGDYLYYIAPDRALICADTRNGNIVWRCEMVRELQVFPGIGGCYFLTPPPGPPLIVGDLVFAITGNGSDGDKVVSPGAPSFVAINKRTGKLVWQSNLPGENIIAGQWSSPTCAVVNGMPQVIFAGGDGVIYSFEPESGKLLWRCDCLPTRKQSKVEDDYFVAAPVVVGDRLYIGLGMHPYPFRPTSQSSYFLCLDITKRGDVSLKNYDAKSPANRDSALVWAFGGPIQPEPERGRREFFSHTISAAAIHGGLVYIGEESGYLNCLDARTGRRYWMHDINDRARGSPYWADGKVYLASECDVKVFAHGIVEQQLARIEMDRLMWTTPVAHNGVLYVMTDRRLYAIAHDK